MVQHGLNDCPGLGSQKRTFILLMKFYNAPRDIDCTKKAEVFKAALGKRSLLKVVCNFLLKIWKWDDNQYNANI